MNGENSPSNWPEIGTPILGPEQKEFQGGAKTLKIDEEKRSQAIKIFARFQNTVFEKQNSLNKELQRANEDLQKTTAELAQKQQSLVAIHENINELLKQLNASHAGIQALYQLIEGLTSPDPSVVNPIIQKAIDRYEEYLRININNSVNKAFEFNNYN